VGELVMQAEALHLKNFLKSGVDVDRQEGGLMTNLVD
jgi:hypothetical protein